MTAKDLIPTKSKVGRKLKCNLSKTSKDKLKRREFLLIFSLLLSSLLAIACFVIFNQNWYPLTCSSSLNKTEVFENLRLMLHGQNAALLDLQHAYQYDFDNRIIFVIGGTGQGKTFTTQIISETLELNNVKILFRQHISEAAVKPLLKTLQCDYSLIIIDDLNLDDIDNIVKYLNNLFYYNFPKFDLVAVMNSGVLYSETPTNLSSIVSDINSRVEGLNIPLFFVKFRELSFADVKLCARDSLQTFSILPTEANIESVMDLITSDDCGCKDVYSKVKLFFGKQSIIIN